MAQRKAPAVLQKAERTLAHIVQCAGVLVPGKGVGCVLALGPIREIGRIARTHVKTTLALPESAQVGTDRLNVPDVLLLHRSGKQSAALGLELQPEGSALLSAAVQEQDIGHIEPVCADLRAFRQGEGSFDVCACNPPYFTDGPQSQNAAHALARHENTCTLDDVCQCAFRLLKDGGRFALCHRPERLAEVLAVLRANRLEPKRLAFVKNKADGAPWLFLVEAQKNRKTGLRVEPDVLISAGAALYGR